MTMFVHRNLINFNFYFIRETIHSELIITNLRDHNTGIF